jgi:hypothetical protein
MKPMRTIILIGITLIIETALFGFPVRAEEAVSRTGEYKNVNIKDPFLPLYPKKESEKPISPGVFRPVKKEVEEIKPPDLNVQGLVWGKISPQAIVNDKVVSLGDVIEDAKIIEISQNGIRILYKGDIFLIKPQIAGGKEELAAKRPMMPMIGRRK